MSEASSTIFRRHSRPMEPIPTGMAPSGEPLPGIRAVLFDLYGTLVVSGSGEVGTQAAPSDVALAEAFTAVGLDPPDDPADAVARLFETIRARHDERRRAGIAYPEVDIRDVWRCVLDELGRGGAIDPAAAERVDTSRLAVEYEARANPVWPMPGAEACLRGLAKSGRLLGLVSNAQFYTRELFAALFGATSESLGFAPELEFFSYQCGHGKPSTRLFELAAEALAARGIDAAAAVCVGNDVLNDVVPARQVGFRTALFAGDARSLRLRQDDPRVGGITPDLVLTDLRQLQECMIG